MNNLLNEIVEKENLISLVLSKPRKKSNEVKKVIAHPVIINSKLMYQLEYHYENKVIHYNLEKEDFTPTLLELVNDDFKQVNIFTHDNDIQVLANKADNPKIIKNKPSKTKESVSHNRQKNYIIPDGTPCDFLIELGVMDDNGKVFQKHYSKFRQINRFLEIVSDSLSNLPKNKTLKIIDFGCGKSYLTFALYYYLKLKLNLDIEIVGLDLKENVIRFCNDIARKLHYNGLAFQLGDIANYKETSCDMVVTLHACDTATDYALINAVNWQAKVILSVPCCQHELFKEINSNPENAMLKHGIIKDKFTELLTDGLRGLKLEAKGYDVTMIEFTSLEHTSKNIMIKALLNPKVSKERLTKAQKEYEALRDKYQVHPTIDTL